MKMAELLEKDASLLGVFARMGLSFGYGEATVEEVCGAAGIDAKSFLVICKVYAQNGWRPGPEDLEGVDLGFPLPRLLCERSPQGPCLRHRPNDGSLRGCPPEGNLEVLQ